MKRILLALVLALVVGFSAAPSAYAAPAYNTAFTVAITYQNVGTQPADITVDFFQENSGTPITFPAGTLNASASTSLAVGTAITTGSFKGSAVLSSNHPVIATIVQLDPTGTIRNRPLSNGFSATDGAPKQLVATVLKNAFSSTTYFSVQNVGAAAINVTVDFYAVGSATPTHTATHNNLPASSAKYFDAGTITQLPDGFSGSAVVRAKLASDNTTDANIVVTVDEMSTTGPGSSSFEGTALSSATVFMPSAMCNAFGGQNTAYAIQNADLTNNVTFQVRYKITLPSVSEVIDGPFTIPGGGKQSVGGCAKMPAGSSGSAIIERTAGTGTLVAVGKVAGLNITSAFLGIPAGGGSANVALPYIRWSPDSTINNNGQQRAGVAIQNIGTADATNVRVEYRDRDGVLKGTHTIGTIAAGGKISSDPKLGNALDACGRFGMYGAGGSTTDCNTVLFGGGAKVVADSGAQLAVVVRIFTGSPILAGEDYTGINVQ
jgi:hypothetical protein